MPCFSPPHPSIGLVQLGLVLTTAHPEPQPPQSTQEELHSLQHQAELSQRRLVRAEKLTGALADESVRWAAQAERMTTTLHLLVGDVFLAAAAVSYLGAFTGACVRVCVCVGTRACRRVCARARCLGTWYGSQARDYEESRGICRWACSMS